MACNCACSPAIWVQANFDFHRSGVVLILNNLLREIRGRNSEILSQFSKFSVLQICYQTLNRDPEVLKNEHNGHASLVIDNRRLQFNYRVIVG